MGIAVFFLFLFFMAGFGLAYAMLKSGGASYRGSGAGARILVLCVAAVIGAMALEVKYDHMSHDMYNGIFESAAAAVFGAAAVGVVVAVLCSFGSPPTDG